MEEQLATGDRSMTYVEQDDMTVSGKKFFVHLAGKTNDAHQEMVKNLRDIGKDQVSSFEESDFLVVFCPVVSRVVTDINAALKGIQGGKPTILVVMHHTYDPERIVAPSSRQVKDPNVRLTVDCLFHEGSLLDCDLSRGAWTEVQKLLGSPRSAVPPPPSWQSGLSGLSGSSLRSLRSGLSGSIRSMSSGLNRLSDWLD